MKKKILTWIILVIALAMFLFSGISLLKAYMEYKKGSVEYDGLETWDKFDSFVTELKGGA